MANKQSDPVVTTNETPAEGAAREAAKKVAQAEAAAPEKAQAVAERGEPVVAVNLITQTGDDGKPEDILPGTVFKPAQVDVAFLKKHDAIRKPTDGELAIYEALQRNKVVSAEDVTG